MNIFLATDGRPWIVCGHGLLPPPSQPPSHPIILHPIAGGPRRLIGDRSLHRLPRQRGINERAGNAPGGHVLNLFPAIYSICPTSFAFAREADAGEALAGGKHDPANVSYQLLRSYRCIRGELHAVEGDQFFEGELDGLEHRQSIFTRAWR